MRTHEIDIDGDKYQLIVAPDKGNHGDVTVTPMRDGGRVAVRYPDDVIALPMYSVALETRMDFAATFGGDAVKHLLATAERDLREWKEKGWLQTTRLAGPEGDA